jgi:DNA-binding FrmR family transcriptional regulator
MRKIITGKVRGINEDLSPPASYYNDPKWDRYQLRLKRLREAYREKRRERENEMEKETIHWKELGRIKRVIGQLNGILKMIEEGSPECREMAYQLKSASTVLRKCALYILKRHNDRCLKAFTGSEEARFKEIELTSRAILEILSELRTIGKSISQWEAEAMIDGIEFKKISED